MRTDSELNEIKRFVDSTYNRFGNLLSLDVDKPYDPEHSELGYCYKYTDPVSGVVNYRIVCSKTGLNFTDFRVMMHEYGHIYLTHLDGIHEELDSQALRVFETYRGELIDRINRECGIDFAEKLIERVIDDPQLNHSLHNIAMDMEVNSKVLSKDDVEKMELDLTSLMPKTEEERLQWLHDNVKDPALKDKLKDELNKMNNQAKIKLILPEKFHMKDPMGNEVPFPDNLTYGEYYILIIKNLDQFVKMLVSIKNGGNGDTSGITSQQVQQALNNGKSDAYNQGYRDAIRDYKNGGQPQSQQGQQQSQQGQAQDGNQQSGQQGSSSASSQQGGSQPGSGQGGSSTSNGGQQGGQGDQSNPSALDQAAQDYNQGYQDALRDLANGNQSGQNGMNSLSQLLDETGITDPGQKKGQGQKQHDSGEQDYSDQKSNAFGPNQDAGKDHGSDSRDEADRKRELGQIVSSGGIGCNKEGGSDGERLVDKNVDEVDAAINEVIRDLSSRVIKHTTTRDVMRRYNRGICRSVIAPTISQKVSVTTEPKLVFLIDVSGSMDTRLIDRVLKTISKDLKKLNRGLKYDVIAWNTRLAKHIKDVDPAKSVPSIPCGGGTDMADGIKYFKDNYSKDASLILISDFEDNLEEWHRVEATMAGYSIYGWNYGSYSREDKVDWKYFKQKNFSNYGYGD